MTKPNKRRSRAKQAKPPATAYPVSPYIIGVDWLEVPVRRPAASAAVYHAIGFAPRGCVGRYPRVAVGGAVIVFRRVTRGKDRSGGAADRRGGVLIQLAVDDVESKREQLVELGLAPGRLRVQKRGDRAFDWRDPDGHTVRFVGPAR